MCGPLGSCTPASDKYDMESWRVTVRSYSNVVSSQPWKTNMHVYQIKHKNLSQYLTNAISSGTEPFSYLGISPSLSYPSGFASRCLSSFLFLPVLHAPLSFDYWLVCVIVCVYLEIEQDGHLLGERRITDGPCQISVHLALFLSNIPHTHKHTHRNMHLRIYRYTLHLILCPQAFWLYT